MVADVPMGSCPCGNSEAYSACCQPYHEGKPAPTPEHLMRSRYCAFALKLTDYLQATWHSSTRPQTLDLTGSPRWASLRVLSASESGSEGRVHFRAIYRADRGWGYLEEESTFVREGGHWYYIGGDTTEGMLKPGRNEPCPCGSGKKHKVCCL